MSDCVGPVRNVSDLLGLFVQPVPIWRTGSARVTMFGIWWTVSDYGRTGSAYEGQCGNLSDRVALRSESVENRGDGSESGCNRPLYGWNMVGMGWA